MIFGKSYKEKHQIKQAHLKKLLNEGQRTKKYAWYPIQTNQGKWVWFDYVYRDYGIYLYRDEFYRQDRRPISYINPTGSI